MLHFFLDSPIYKISFKILFGSMRCSQLLRVKKMGVGTRKAEKDKKPRCEGKWSEEIELKDY